ncbi:MAG: type 1 glutamine amidotransferase [Solirubrobacterales bacterium]
MAEGQQGRNRGLILQNEANAPAGYFADWLEARGIEHEIVRPFQDFVPVEPQSYGWICSLGSDSSTNQDEPEWIPAEIEFLRRAVSADVPVLGICFGGQALARAMGAPVVRAEPPLAGWYEIEPAGEWLSPGPWVHFNSEQLSIPDSARLIAHGPAGAAGFVRGPHLGLQFHPEASPAIVTHWIELEHDKLVERGVEPDAIRAQGERFGAGSSERAFALFDGWWTRARP